ncbi:MAG: hypothetical protein HY775_03140 [Acidobacteria bacterium]|nr:hypothetical protein [Acidobacteriota bacterium]
MRVRVVIVVALATLGVALAGLLAVVGVAGNNASGDANTAVFNDNPPADRWRASGGPFASREQAERAAHEAAGAHGDGAATIVETRFLSYGEAWRLTGWGGSNASIADDREVYLVRLRGSFQGRPHPRFGARHFAAAFVIVDATTGGVLDFGEGPA